MTGVKKTGLPLILAIFAIVLLLCIWVLYMQYPAFVLSHPMPPADKLFENFKKL